MVGAGKVARSRPRTGGPPIISQNDRPSRRVRDARINRRPPRYSATITALAIVAALAYIFLLRAPDPQPAPKVSAISGSSTWTLEDASGQRTRRGQFAAAAGPDLVEQVAAAAGTDADRVHSPLDYAGLAAVVRSAVADSDRSVGVKPLEEDGRRVWRAAMKLDGRVVDLVVDQATGLVQWYASEDTGAAGLPREEFDVTRIAYDDQATATPTPLPGPHVPEKGGERYFASLAAAAAAAGFTPVASALVPDGFRLAAISSPLRRDLGQDAAGPAEPTPGLELLYTKDLTTFRVAQSSVTDAEARRLSAEAAAAGSLGYETTPVQYGVFEGTTAQTWFAPEGPTMLLTGGGYAVLVNGGLTRQELLDLSEGFKKVR